MRGHLAYTQVSGDISAGTVRLFIHDGGWRCRVRGLLYAVAARLELIADRLDRWT